MEVKDGKYVVHRFLNGEDKILGRFTIKGGSVEFVDEVDRMNIDQFPAGLMSAHTKSRISYLLTDQHKDVYIKKV